MNFRSLAREESALPIPHPINNPAKGRWQVPEGNVTKLESRWIAFITAVALLFGGWWLQNQYDTVLRLQKQQTAFMRHVDDKYVQKDTLVIVSDRLDRIENKIDALRDKDNKTRLERPAINDWTSPR